MHSFAQKKELSEEHQQTFTRHFINAESQRLQGNYDKALEFYAKCDALSPKNDAVLFGKGRVYQEQNLHIEAEDHFKQAVHQDNDNKWYKHWLAQNYLDQRDPASASEIYHELSKSDPENDEYALNYANTLLLAGKAKKAMKAFDAYEETFGLNRTVSQRKYEYFLSVGDMKNAAKEVEKLIESSPTEQQLYGVLADIYKSQGNESKALEVYERAIKQDPNNPYIQMSLAEYYDRTGKPDTSYAYLKRAYSNPSLDIDTKVGILIKMYGEAGKHQNVRTEGLELCSLLVETHPDDPKSHAVHADYLLLNNDKPGAQESYRKTLELDPSRFAVWNQLILVDSELGDSEGMLNDANKALELFPSQANLYLFKGVAHIQLQQYAEAVKPLKDGVGMVYGNAFLSAQMLASLGDAYHELENHKGSDSAYAASLTFNPENDYVLNNYSYFLSLRKENLLEAKSMMESVLTRIPDNASYLDTYGWVLFNLGEYNAAEEYLQKALDFGGNSSAEVLEHYGDVLFELGKTTEAVDYWKLAAEKESTPELLNKIESRKRGE